MAKLQEQILTQKKFSKPSDDPVAAMMGMNYRTSLNKVEQYSRNIGEASSWIESTDLALGQMTEALQRIRELTVKASNTGTDEEAEREAVASEIEQLKQHIIDIGDTQVGGRYIFNGFSTDKRPSDTLNDPGGLEYAEGIIEIEVFEGIKLPLNTNGNDIFQGAIGQLEDVLTAIRTYPAEGEITGQLGAIDSIIDNVNKIRAEVGARQNRIDIMIDRLEDQEIFAKKILTENEGVDIEEIIIQLTTQESINRAALNVGARVIQPSLLDFLR